MTAICYFEHSFLKTILYPFTKLFSKHLQYGRKERECC